MFCYGRRGALPRWGVRRFRSLARSGGVLRSSCLGPFFSVFDFGFLHPHGDLSFAMSSFGPISSTVATVILIW